MFTPSLCLYCFSALKRHFLSFLHIVIICIFLQDTGLVIDNKTCSCMFEKDCALMISRDLDLQAQLFDVSCFFSSAVSSTTPLCFISCHPDSTTCSLCLLLVSHFVNPLVCPTTTTISPSLILSLSHNSSVYHSSSVSISRRHFCLYCSICPF